MKQSLEWANQRGNELVEENKRLSEEVNGFKNTVKQNVKTIEILNNLTDVQDKELTEAKEIIENIIRVTWGEGWNYSLDWKVKAEQFLKEVKE